MKTTPIQLNSLGGGTGSRTLSLLPCAVPCNCG